ncbi:MAG: hypothetical protein C4523_11215 [Myxococcales bacterium]|nr:MAG: hypothetical protein C4523_11215 [Myxococcales bacterium]
MGCTIRFRLRVICLLFSVCAAAAFGLAAGEARGANDSGDFFLIPIENTEQIDVLGEAGISIRHRTAEGVVVRIEADKQELARQLGFVLRRLPRDPALPSRFKADDYFHDNQEVGEILDNLATAYPDLTRRFTIGRSVENRLIHGIVVSANAGESEFEPEVRIQGAIHGNELMSVEIPLKLADYLTSTYATSPRTKAILDSTEIYIIPLLNPDGRLRQSRMNANGVDLNRTFGYQYLGAYPGDTFNLGPFSQPESRALASHIMQRNPVLAFSYHTTEYKVNWVWNYTELPTPDEALIIDLSDRYASFSGYESINGADWYKTRGDTNDFSYGARGVIEWTIELSDNDIAAVWNRNQLALIDAIEHASLGLSGLVTDAESGEPLEALVLMDDPFWPVYTDPEVGDYHRILAGGRYAAAIWAPGYAPLRLDPIVIPTDGHVRRDAALTFNDEYYAFQAVAVQTAYLNSSFSPAALGPPDGRSFSLTRRGYAVFDMGVAFGNTEGETLVVHEGEPLDHEYYSVYVSDGFFTDATWTMLGEANETASFDIPFGGGPYRYVMIVDYGQVVGTSAPGFDLDAVELVFAPPPVDGDEEIDENDVVETDGDADGIDDVDLADDEEIDRSPDGDDGDFEEETENPDGDDDLADTDDPDVERSAETEEITDLDSNGDDDREPIAEAEAEIERTDKPEREAESTFVIEDSDSGCRQTNDRMPLVFAVLVAVWMLRRGRYRHHMNGVSAGSANGPSASSSQ